MKIEHSDLANIIELLKTLRLDVVAEKWETTPVKMARFLRWRGYTAIEIRREYRYSVIDKMSRYKEHKIAIALNLSVYELRRIIRLRGDE